MISKTVQTLPQKLNTIQVFSLQPFLNHHNNINMQAIHVLMLANGTNMMESILLDSHHPLVEVPQLVSMCAPVHLKLDGVSELLPYVAL